MLKQFSPIILICVETKWPGSWFAVVVLGFVCYLLAMSKYVATVLNKIKIMVRKFVMKWVYISMINVWLMYDQWMM